VPLGNDIRKRTRAKKLSLRVRATNHNIKTKAVTEKRRISTAPYTTGSRYLDDLAVIRLARTPCS
jgi:hypothetical protein